MGLARIQGKGHNKVFSPILLSFPFEGQTILLLVTPQPLAHTVNHSIHFQYPIHTKQDDSNFLLWFGNHWFFLWGHDLIEYLEGTISSPSPTRQWHSHPKPGLRNQDSSRPLAAGLASLVYLPIDSSSGCLIFFSLFVGTCKISNGNLATAVPELLRHCQ